MNSIAFMLVRGPYLDTALAAARRTGDAELIRKVTLAVLEVRDRTSP